MEAGQEEGGLYDARFEFDAPRYYDFEAVSSGTPADKWFDTAPDGPGCKPAKAGGSREPFKELQDNISKQDKGQQAGVEAAATGMAAGDQTVEQKPKQSNIVTSWAQGAAAEAAGRQSSIPAAGIQGDAAATSRPASAKALGAKEPRRVQRSDDKTSGMDSSSQQPMPRSEPPVTRSMSRLGVGLFSPVPEHKAKCSSPPLTRSRAAGHRFYTVQKAKATTARTKPPASVQKLYQVLQPKVTKPARSTKPLTLPDDIELQTSKRFEGRPGATQQPERSPFKPLAERVREFQYKTPPRFKSRPSKAATNKKKSPITKAEAPRLLTSMRNRPKSCKSQVEMEEEQLRRMQQEQFKARPVDTRVLSSSGQLGVPKVDKPHVTEPKPFTLRSDSRARVRCSHEQPTMQQAAAAHFKAQPLNKSILDGPTFKPHKQHHGLTKPVSPELLTKKRALTGGAAEAQQRSDRPHTRSTAEQQEQQPGHCSQAGTLRVTQPQPFRLQTEARGALHQSEMAAKLAADEARAKRLRRVTARPLPVTVDVPVVPAKPEPKALTLPDPFPLKSMERHEEYEQQQRAKLQQEQEAARRAAEFKARPIAGTGPFVVHESDAPLTVPEDPHLATEARAAGRAEFDAHMVARMQQEEEEQRRQEQLKRQQEEEAVREYRKKLRFSARPMPSFGQPFFAMPSERPLTNPKTPNFASKKLKKTG